MVSSITGARGVVCELKHSCIRSNSSLGLTHNSCRSSTYKELMPRKNRIFYDSRSTFPESRNKMKLKIKSIEDKKHCTSSEIQTHAVFEAQTKATRGRISCYSCCQRRLPPFLFRNSNLFKSSPRATYNYYTETRYRIEFPIWHQSRHFYGSYKTSQQKQCKGRQAKEFLRGTGTRRGRDQLVSRALDYLGHRTARDSVALFSGR